MIIFGMMFSGLVELYPGGTQQRFLRLFVRKLRSVVGTTHDSSDPAMA